MQEEGEVGDRRSHAAGFGEVGNVFLDVVYSLRDNALNCTFMIFKLCGKSPILQ